jgi:hypothetical protein
VIYFNFRARLIRCLLPEYPSLPTEQCDLIAADIYQSVIQLIQLAPWHIRMGEKILRVLLIFWMLLTTSGSLKTTDISAVNRALSRFQKHSNTLAGIVRLYRSLLILCFYEHPLVTQAINQLPSQTRSSP